MKIQYCSDLQLEFKGNNQPDYWIYGHTHSNTTDFAICNTQLLCNQLGYVKYNEHQLFNNKKIFIL